MSKAITDAFMGYVPDMYWAKNRDVFVFGFSSEKRYFINATGLPHTMA